jgi:hypothetical protein
MKEKISSKLNIFPNIIIILISIGIFVGIGIMLVLRFFEKLETENKTTWENLVFPFLILVFIIYLLKHIVNNFPKIVIEKSGINFSTYFKKEFYDWNEIENIKITGKENLKFLFTSMPFEATTLNLKNGKKKNIWADNYSNISEIRVLLDRAEKILSENRTEINFLDFKINRNLKISNQINFKNKIEFNGNHFLSANGLLFYGFIVFILYMFFQNPTKMINNYQALFFILIVGIVMCGIFSFKMHYFIITEKYIIVKNSIWFWFNKVYEIENIKELVIETPHKQSTSLRIITNDFHSKIYQAGSLRDSTWTKMKEYLLKKEIVIRNETYH